MKSLTIVQSMSLRSVEPSRVRRGIITGDQILRSLVRKVFRKGVVENKHVYKK